MANKKTNKKQTNAKRTNVTTRVVRQPTYTGQRLDTSARGDELHRLIANGGLTQDGANWVVAALDPFHDVARVLAGYPDVDSSKTVVSSFSFTKEITFAAGTWDFHTFSLPVTATDAAYYVGSAANHRNSLAQVVPTYASTYYTLGPVNGITVPSGSPMFPTSAAWNPAGATFADFSADIGSLLNQGFSRVIAAGLEVVNTTSALDQSGSCVCYRMPANATPTTIRVTDATAGNLCDGSTVMNVIRPPPSSMSEAMLLRGTTEWNNKHGAYMPITQSRIENPLKSTASQPVVFMTQSGDVASVTVQQKALGGAVTTAPSFWANKTNSQDICGMMFTGLNQGTTLRLKYTVLVETAPTFKEYTESSLASPSAEYDPDALKLYAKIVNKMPIATFSSNNANGDWFKAILKTIHSVVRPIAAIFGRPARDFVDKAYGGLNKVVRATGEAFPLLW
jgi:hypothetical protein